MICPLPRASEVSALRESRLRGRCPHGGGHGLHPGGLGAGDEGARDFPAGHERGDQLVAGRGDHRRDAAEYAALAKSLRELRVRWAARSTAAEAVEPGSAIPGGPTDPAVVSGEVRRVQRSALSSNCLPRARRNALVQLREEGLAGGRALAEEASSRASSTAAGIAGCLWTRSGPWC